MDKKNYLPKILGNVFNEAMMEINSLKDFYDTSNKFLIEKKFNFDKDYHVGFEFSKLLDTIFKKDSIEDKRTQLECVNNTILIDDKKVKDIAKLEVIEKEDGLSFLIGINKKYSHISP